MFSKETYEFTPVYVMAMFEYMQQQFDIIKWQNAVIMRALLRQGIITDEDDLAIRNMFLSRDSNSESAVNITRAFSGFSGCCEVSNQKFIDDVKIEDETLQNKFIKPTESKFSVGQNIGIENSVGQKLKIENTTKSKKLKSKKYVGESDDNFRVKTSQLYLTYPQSGDITKEDVLDKVVSVFGEPDQYIICLELHQDGNPHIHAYIKYDKTIDRTCNSRILDIHDKHGNYQTDVRSPKHVIKYCAKDSNYISKGIDVELLLSKFCRERNGIRMQIATDIIDNDKNIYEVVKTYKTPIFGYSNLSRDIASYRDAKTDAELIHRPLREFKLFDLTFTFEGRHKEKQFWIVGPTNTGKTTMIESFMNDGYLAYKMPPNEKNFVGWHNKHSYCYITEYYGSYTIGFYNTFLEGGSGDGWKMPIEVKYGNVEKTINVPVFTESNLYPHEVYKNATRTQLDALMSRLNIIEVFPNVVGPGWKSARILPPNEYHKTLNKVYIERAVLPNSKYYK